MTAFALGIRLGLKGSRVRLAVTAVAMAFAVAFLLAVLGALPARQAKLDRLAARAPQNDRVAAAVGTPPNAPEVHLQSLYTWYRGQPLSGYRVADAQPGQPIPPGITRLPRPGELMVSPALAEVLRGPHAGELTTRLPGRVVAEIAQDGLSGPDELFAWVGTTKVAAPQPTRGFGYRAERTPAPRELRIAAQLGALGLLLPVLVLVATATRLSAATRDRRLAAIRLVGGSSRQVAGLAAGEGLVLGLAGTALGAAVFLLLRPVAASLVPVAGGVFPMDLRPPTGQGLAVLLAVPALSVVASLAAMRRVVTSPLEVRRLARPHRAVTPWRLVPLGLGLVLLGVLWFTDRWIALTVLGGGGLTLVGLALVTSLVSSRVGALLARSPGLGAALAGRRLVADPTAAGRALTGTVIVVFAGTWLLAFLPLLQRYQGSAERDLATVLPSHTVLASTGQAEGVDAVRGRVAAVDGVRRVVVLRTAMLASEDDASTSPDLMAEAQQVAVGSCAELVALLAPSQTCGTSRAHTLQLGEAQGEVNQPLPTSALALDGNGKATVRVQVPASRPDLRLPMAAQGLNGIWVGGLLLEPELVPPSAGFANQLVVLTDGSEEAVERVRASLPGNEVFGAFTLEEALAQQDRVLLGYQRAARLGLVLAVLVGAVSLLVTVVDEVSRRRRDIAALVALGVPHRVLRRAFMLHAAAPALACTTLAVVVGGFASAAYLRRDEGELFLPWGSWAGVSAAAFAALVGVTTLTLPLTRNNARPEHLRTS